MIVFGASLAANVLDSEPGALSELPTWRFHAVKVRGVVTVEAPAGRRKPILVIWSPTIELSCEAE